MAVDTSMQKRYPNQRFCERVPLRMRRSETRNGRR